jgi:folate-dependent phosphoribosylglycinamide formyltransferase PurN
MMKTSSDIRYKILLLCVDCDTSRMLFHALEERWDIKQVFIEEPVHLKNKIKYRLKKLGLISVIGQLFFKLVVDLAIKPFSQKRKNDILFKYKCSIEALPDERIFLLDNIHDGDWDYWIALHKPDFIIINGTRILKKSFLDKINVPIINIHTGVTPMYRGVHGGYWALANRDKSNFGSTIHLVDAGVDTGKILKQVHVNPDVNDNFYTYPYLQSAIAIKELFSTVELFLKGVISNSEHDSSNEKSKQYYYPTLWEYLYYRIKNNVR